MRARIPHECFLLLVLAVQTARSELSDTMAVDSQIDPTEGVASQSASDCLTITSCRIDPPRATFVITGTIREPTKKEAESEKERAEDYGRGRG